MLDIALKYKSELQSLFQNVVYGSEEYKYWNYAGYWDVSSSSVDESDWSSISRVSKDYNNKILGFFKAIVLRDSNKIDGMSIVNFNLKTCSITFIRDLESFIEYLFSIGFNKIKFNCVIGNSAERLYDKFIIKYNGRIVGISKQEIKLVDGKYHDVKLYEILRSEYETNYL